VNQTSDLTYPALVEEGLLLAQANSHVSMGQSTPLDATKMEEQEAGKSSVGDSGGASPVLTDGDRSSSSSSRPSGADLSSFAEDRTSPTGENAKPAPRKVTIPEQGISSYKALEEGLHTSSTEDSAPRAKSSPPKIITTTNKSTKSRKTSLRRGKWTVEEEAYVARVIRDFNYGYLDAPAGTTLRTYLSDKLKCDPMRITKKFTGDACIGKRVFHPAVRSAENSVALDQAQVCFGVKSQSVCRCQHISILTCHVALPFCCM